MILVSCRYLWIRILITGVNTLKKKQKNNKQVKQTNINSRPENLQPSIRNMTKQSNVVSLEETKIYKKNSAALKEH
jgi:peroxiredoxin family protein